MANGKRDYSHCESGKDCPLDIEVVPSNSVGVDNGEHYCFGTAGAFAADITGKYFPVHPTGGFYQAKTQFKVRRISGGTHDGLYIASVDIQFK